MLIGINTNNEIKQINEITDENLVQIEIDREQVFGSMSDFMILNYKYTPYEYGYSLSPARDYTTLQIENKINILEQGLKATLRGDMQELAYILYPNDFKI